MTKKTKRKTALVKQRDGKGNRCQVRKPFVVRVIILRLQTNLFVFKLVFGYGKGGNEDGVFRGEV